MSLTIVMELLSDCMSMKKKKTYKLIYGIFVAGVTASFFNAPVFAGESEVSCLSTDTGLSGSEQSPATGEPQGSEGGLLAGNTGESGISCFTDEDVKGGEDFRTSGDEAADAVFQPASEAVSEGTATYQDSDILYHGQSVSCGMTAEDKSASSGGTQKEENPSTTRLNTEKEESTTQLQDSDSDTAAVSSPVSREKASQTSAFGNIYIDLNGDGVTTAEDEQLLSRLIAAYDMKDHNGQEISGELARILYGPLVSAKETEAPGFSSYYLNNAGQATYVKSQGALGTCWAFATAASLESAMLKERLKLSGIDITAPTEGEPVLEGLKTDPDISEKYLAWLAYDHKINDGAQNEGISSERTGSDILGAGGLFGFPDSYWTSWRGIVNESDEPYKPDNRADSYIEAKYGETTDKLPEQWSLSGRVYPTGDPTAPARANKVITLPAPAIIEYKDGANVWTGYDSGATDLIKRTLVETGAVAISYAADQSYMSESGNRNYFNHKTWSQYNDSESVKVNHSVAIVGWNDDYPAENFKAEKNSLPPGNGAWLVKNSWGSYDWYEDQYGDTFTNVVEHLKEFQKDDVAWGIPGETGVGTGYFWLSYYDKSISSAMAFGVDIPDDGWDHDRIYQYNYYSDMASIPLVLRMYDSETSVANIFTAEEQEVLDAVSVRTTEHDSRVNVKVYLLDDGAFEGDPTAGELVSEIDAEIELAGFTTLKLPKSVTLKSGQRFAVVETIAADSGFKDSAVSFLNVETVLNDDKQNEANMGAARSYVYSAAGQTFAKVLSGGVYTWMSPEALTKELGGGIFNFGNALIKAFTILAETQSGEEQKADAQDTGIRKDTEVTDTGESSEKDTFTDRSADAGAYGSSSKGGALAAGRKAQASSAPVSKAQMNDAAGSKEEGGSSEKEKIQTVAAGTGDINTTGVWMAAAAAAVSMLVFVKRWR